MTVKNPKVVLSIAILFVLVQFAAIAFMTYALDTQDQVFENPEDPLIAVYYILLLLGFTGLFMLLIKFKRDSFIRIILFTSIGFVIFFVAFALADVFMNDYAAIFSIGVIFGVISIAALWRKPEWYIVDFVGIIMAIGIVALLGISLSILPVLILLLALAIYDAIAVFKTKHMITLAEGVIDLGLPILLIIPKKLPYSYIKSKPKVRSENPEEREAFIMGLGDIIIPGLLPASAFWFIDPAYELFGIAGNFIVALGAVIGALAGLMLLLRAVSTGKAQPGLPFLNTGCIIGYFISYFAVFGTDLTQII